MSEASPALVLTGLTKVYRLYTRPGYKVLDLLGLCPPDLAHYSEHVALHPIDLTLNRGDKVAIIGRNGAGKSTLLKLITGAATPTAGRIELHGRISPLLQIGTGFHPDFTGRQNVFANLAHMGIVGREAARRFEEIVDFAELEQFIDQPMKT
jgi:lipopolysaccharide transport system ATP-binding protein